MMVDDYVETQIQVVSIKGFNKPVTLSSSWISPAPTGVTISFDQNPVTPPAGGSISSTLNITTTRAAIPGIYQLYVTGINDLCTVTIFINILIIIPGIISGDVLEVGLFDTIPGAVVTAEVIGLPWIYTTNDLYNPGVNQSDGTYWLMVPPDEYWYPWGPYRVWANAPGYIPSTGFWGDRVHVEAGKETSGIYFRLLPTFTRIHGTVTNANTGLPIRDALIDVLGPRYPLGTEPYENVRIKTRTNASGNYNITLEYTVQPSGNYTVTASAVGFQDNIIVAPVSWNEIIADYTWILVNFTLVPAPGVTCLDPAVIIDYARTAVTDDPVGEGFDVANAPAIVDLATAKGFTIAAAGPDGAYSFDITFPTPVNRDFVLYKLPAWTGIPYALTGANTVQVQLAINGGILDPAFILAAICGDVTGDNKVTMGDARRIEMWLSYPEDYPINNLWAADVTGDGEVTGDDARRIIMWLSDPEQYPLACSTP
jgi:hypothetical protein